MDDGELIIKLNKKLQKTEIYKEIEINMIQGAELNPLVRKYKLTFTSNDCIDSLCIANAFMNLWSVMFQRAGNVSYTELDSKYYHIGKLRSYFNSCLQSSI